MLKKIIVTISILLIISWVGLTWHISKQTNDLLNSDQFQLAHIQPLHYDQGILSSTLRFKLNTKTGNSEIDHLLENIIFNANIQHSPIHISAAGIKTGFSHWQITPEPGSFSKEMQAHLKKAFLAKDPLHINVHIDFNNQASYSLDIAKAFLHEYDRKIGTISPSHFSGKLDLATLSGDLQGTMGELSIKDKRGSLNIPALFIHTTSEGINSNDITANTVISADTIHYQSKLLSNDIHFGFTLNTEQRLSQQILSNTLNLHIKDAKTPDDLIKDLKLDIHYKGTLESTRKYAIEAQESPLLQSLLEQLKEKQGVIDLNLNITGGTGEANIKANIAPLSNSSSQKQILDIFKTDLQLLADTQYIDQTPLILLLNAYINKHIVLIEDKKYTLHLTTHGNSATLNGNHIDTDVLTRKLLTTKEPNTHNNTAQLNREIREASE